jgi:putative transposase
MPRHPRLDLTGTIHHIIERDIAGTKVFSTKKDKADFMQRVGERSQADGLNIYAWAVMDTHFHLLVRTGVY